MSLTRPTITREKMQRALSSTLNVSILPRPSGAYRDRRYGLCEDDDPRQPTSMPNDSSLRSSASVLMRASKAFVSGSLRSPGFLASTKGRIRWTSFFSRSSILRCISLAETTSRGATHLFCFSSSRFFSNASNCAFCSGDNLCFPFLSLSFPVCVSPGFLESWSVLALAEPGGGVENEEW